MKAEKAESHAIWAGCNVCHCQAGRAKQVQACVARDGQRVELARRRSQDGGHGRGPRPVCKRGGNKGTHRARGVGLKLMVDDVTSSSPSVADWENLLPADVCERRVCNGTSLMVRKADHDSTDN